MKVPCETCGALAEAQPEPGQGGGAALRCGACGAPVELPSPAAESQAEPAAAEGEAARSPATPEEDEAAWAAVLSRWADEEAHRAFLSRFADLDGLAGAGRRYREVLSQRPGDAVARRWRDEILKRATVQGLAQLPRLSPPGPSPRLYRRAVLGGMIGAMALAAGWLAWRLLSMARG